MISYRAEVAVELQSLREQVLEANLELHRRGLALYTWGNASGIDRARGLVVIKPSGVPYERLAAADLVVTDLDGAVVAGSLRPSSDLRTHLALYRAWDDIGGVVHTHSTHATAWCQARRALPCLGTTHADHAAGAIPCAAPLSAAAVAGDYEAATGAQILAAMAGSDHRHTPMVLVGGHAPFTWGADPAQAAHHAVVLEELARLALLTYQIDPRARPLPPAIADKHWQRKHGPGRTYGQQ
jgi:L-ribulose-5-phosphate 4-epimerase